MEVRKQDFLRNLLNYIPLGSGTFWLRDKDALAPPAEWTETGVSPELMDANHVIYQPLKILVCTGWARVYIRKHQIYNTMLTVRVYVLPDDVGRRYLDRNNSACRKCLKHLVTNLDPSFESWEGRNEAVYQQEAYNKVPFFDFKQSNDDSLFYIFNNLPSPKPDPSRVSCPYARQAIISLLEEPLNIKGIKTTLYPYQKRSAATMILRETAPLHALDPRVEPFKGPTGCKFYYDEVTGTLLRDRRGYQEACGGILAETMGLGKTLICLAAVLATKGHCPRIPAEYNVDFCKSRPKVGTLMEMAAAAIGREQIQWRAHLMDLAKEGAEHTRCIAMLQDTIGAYIIPAPIIRSRRFTRRLKGRRMRLCCATLIIVPITLILQWTNEIALHLEENALKVFLADSCGRRLPSADDLLLYDVILMSRSRFEQEFKSPATDQLFSGEIKECTCEYSNECSCSSSRRCSPLKSLHFLRVIVDEGHDFVSSGTSSLTTWAYKDLCFERKWIVSGTPAGSLLGVEVDLAANETLHGEHLSNRTTQGILEARRIRSSLEQERKDLSKLGRIAIDFLNVRPWANSRGEDPASWETYVMPAKDDRRKPRSLVSVLESLVVRHRIEDIERDVCLPPLHNKIVYLRPSWHDKLSMNMFIINLTANAVTSERIDGDYMFHPSNRSEFEQLITSLRSSGFYWVGFAPKELEKTLGVCRAYLMKSSAGLASCSSQDRILLHQVIEVGTIILASPSWKALAESKEIGIYVDDFPSESCESWALVPGEARNPLLVGATQLIKAQNHVDRHLYLLNPAQGLSTLGVSTMRNLRRNKQVIPAANDQAENKSLMQANRELKLVEKNTMSWTTGDLSRSTKKAVNENVITEEVSHREKPSQLKSALKASSRSKPVEMLPSDSPLARSRISGTVSAKLTYLLDRVVALHDKEKILIFYEGDSIAYFIAQGFDLIGVRYLIYTRRIETVRRNAYITTFNTTETFRVMLMDIRSASHGLHVASASRVFFVNPVWQPNVEAQAIKRAHRIGQTKPVYVETLVLQGTLEDKMLQRRKEMTTEEHQAAKKSLLDDPPMGEIIRNAALIPLAPRDVDDVRRQSANLLYPQTLFGREGRQSAEPSNPNADLVFPEVSNAAESSQSSRKRIAPEFSAVEKSSSKKQMM